MSAIHVATAICSRTFNAAGDYETRYGISFAEVAFAAAISRCPSRKVRGQMFTTGNDFRYG